MQLYIDHILVLIAALIGSVLFCLWYSSFLFQSFYKKQKIKIVFLSSLFLFPISFGIAFLQQYLQVSSFWDGIISAGLLYVFFVLPISVVSFFREKNRVKKIFFFDQLLWVIEFLLLGAILAG